MKNREYFLREDINTYKKKFLRLCNLCVIDIISPKVFAHVKKNDYIRRIKITEL